MRDKKAEELRRRLGAMGRSVRLARWSLRKLSLPIRPGDLVLDVGSGANPHPRADVLLERYVTGQHRHGAAAVANRPIVFADACRMPFKDKAFDYVIAFHVLEHIPTPELFLRELMRIARAGYIETPNVLFERLVPYDVHCLEVMNLGESLHIQKKARPATDPFLERLKVVPRSTRWNDFFYAHPEYFHVCYHWSDRIDFQVVNPEEDCSWYMRGSEDDDAHEVADSRPTVGARGIATELLRRFYARRRANSPIDLRRVLACPECRGDLSIDGEAYECPRCSHRYVREPWPSFVEPTAVGGRSSEVRP
jgi:SAM-dependent methyltransferase